MKIILQCDSCGGRGYQPNTAETDLEPCSDCDGEGGTSYTLDGQRAGTVRLLLAILASPVEGQLPSEGEAPDLTVLPFRPDEGGAA